jgi:putative SOS response-associated peptidase YedK
MINGHWGSNPRFTDGIVFRFVRSEEKTFPAAHRCLIPASEFRMRVEDERYRVKREDGDHFYLAGIWEPAMGDWPLSYRIITVAANREVRGFQDQQGAIILRRQAMEWLDGAVPEAELLVTPPDHTFLIDEIGGAPVQRALAS